MAGDVAARIEPALQSGPDVARRPVPKRTLNIGRALWWSVQTVTTVGYGDVTPRFASGRIVAAAVMLWGVAFLAILTAAITSTFVARAARERTNVGAFEAASAADRIDEQLVDLALRLDRMEDTLSRLAGG